MIVGAGPAGATAAYHLSKQGRSVLLLEKESLPRYKPCGGGLSPAIQQWFDFDLTPVIDNKVNQVHFTWKKEDPVETELDTSEPFWMVKRDVFDNFLVEKAVAAGSELQDNSEVTGVQISGDLASVTTSKGKFDCRYLIAADGATGPMAKWLGFKEAKQFSGAVLEVETSVSAAEQNIAKFDFGSLKNGLLWCFPKSNGYSLSAGVIRGGKGKAKDLEKQLTNYASELGIDLSKSKFYDYPMNLWSSERDLHQKNALLVGDAAGIADPLIAEGIRPSILSGVKAASAVGKALDTEQEALAEYTEAINSEIGADLVLAQRLSGLFFQFPGMAYRVGVKRPYAGKMMSKILCGELRYADITDLAMQRLKSSLIPGRG
ncbi:MAG: geranylgeranyl reductase family protein [Oscillatoria sp. PMC 1076.18]|nr:geranylgeranyl reductase family protein [Oscillatoria sp. PMC 1076.18]